MSDDCCTEKGEKREKNTFDLIVIGAGSAGFSAAITAAEQGKNVAIIGYGMIGGTCVNVGCVPSKAMIRAADVMHASVAADRFNGVSAVAKLESWSDLQAQKQKLVTDLRAAKYIDILPEYETLSYIEGTAKLVPGGVAANGKVYKSDKIIVATGSYSQVPPIDGILDIPHLDSTRALDLTELPTSMIIIGAGVIGCELGQMFARMGTKVTLLCRSNVLAGAEPEISDALAGYLRAEGLDVICGVTYNSIAQEDGIVLRYDHQGKTGHVSAQHVMLAAGRKANTVGLGLEEMDIATAKNGGILVDEFMHTNVPGIYAVGDVTGRDQFVYMAAYGAKLAANNAMKGHEMRYDNSVMPAVVFTDPHYATVGMTEAQARAEGIEVKTSVLSLDHVPRALAAFDTRGLIKLVADAHDNRLIGAHVLAPEGADVIQTAALAIKTGMTYTELGEMIFPYLTTVEGLKLAAQTFDKDVAKLSCCAG
ncbi:MAG TPA: mercury(II) reductase [Hellea balneolensis]|uniref:Mercuric reductase n=1 Tax=Hellea balneolensis TaxID=287478 RepID=A0A7C3C9V0_9PROT|nr:mercury(II) reductase [Hellea balneolensis]